MPESGKGLAIPRFAVFTSANFCVKTAEAGADEPDRRRSMTVRLLASQGDVLRSLEGRRLPWWGWPTHRVGTTASVLLGVASVSSAGTPDAQWTVVQRGG